MTNETKQTAVKHLIHKLTNLGYIQAPSFGHSIIDKIIEDSIEMEKEQHKKTWDDSFEYFALDVGVDFEQYYNENIRR
jgi:hypothetical protein